MSQAQYPLSLLLPSKHLFYFQLSCMRQTVEGRHGFPGPRLSSFPLLYSCGITLQCYILLQFYVICTEEGTCIDAKTFAFFFFFKYSASVIRYTTTIMDPPSHTDYLHFPLLALRKSRESLIHILKCMKSRFSGALRTGSSCFARRCLNYPWGGRYHTINRKAVVSM